ncbi:MAG: ABC-ATPase domain-containing protein [Chitinispirillia bacterium]|jgi:predicted ABC-class ATPase
MKIQNRLSNQLHNIDGRDYALYQSLRGKHDFLRYILFIDRVPKDPYAPPYTGIYRVRVKRSHTGFLDDMTAPNIRRVALGDFLARAFFDNCQKFSFGRRGTGNSGLITIAEPSQCILERSSVVINDEYVEVRFFIGLPSSGRKIESSLAYEMLFKELPDIVYSSLFLENLDSKCIYSHVETCEDADFLRNSLSSRNLVAFVSNDSILPRRSGVDDRPMESNHIVSFRTPDSMQYEFDLPNRGTINGMGIKKGITLIVGGGYHGKSTLLNALEYGIYNHIPGDGREFCVSLSDSVKIRAYSGRYVSNVDISPFLQNMPFKLDTAHFSTENASGSTSQASSIIESIEGGASAFYMDEDTCAANFMIRDRRMQELVSKKNEPITSFIDCVKPLYEQRGISTVLVMGGTGDYFEVADSVIQMQEFKPYNVTDNANKIARRIPTGRNNEFFHTFKNEMKRCPTGNTLDAKNEYGHIRISSGTASELIFGKAFIDLSDVEQLVEKTQTRALGLAIHAFKQQMNGTMSVREIISAVKKKIEEEGIDGLNPLLTGDIAQFRMIELAAAINRMRGLKFETIQ